MKSFSTSFDNTSYEVTNSFCGDCGACPNKCETGNSMLKSWTPKEVAEICDLLMEGPKFLKEMKSLEELK